MNMAFCASVGPVVPNCPCTGVQMQQFVHTVRMAMPSQCLLQQHGSPPFASAELLFKRCVVQCNVAVE